MTRLAPFALFVLLAACGADGMPRSPDGKTSTGPITLSGEARIGITN